MIVIQSENSSDRTAVAEEFILDESNRADTDGESENGVNWKQFIKEVIEEEVLVEQSIISESLDELRQHSEQNRQEIRQLIALVKDMVGQQAQQQETMNSQIETVSQCQQRTAECQKLTAELTNRTLEKYVLHPAIETVDYLFNQLQEVQQKHKTLNSADLTAELDSLLLIAKDKCESLGIEAIIPRPLTEVDKALYQIAQVTSTDDKEKDMTIEKTLIAGLRYQGEVLRPAKVAVYRYQP